MDIKNYNPAKLLLLLVMLTAGSLHAQKVVRYDLYVKDTLVNYAGKEKEQLLSTDRFRCQHLRLLKAI